jgi:hypothetical protein
MRDRCADRCRYGTELREILAERLPQPINITVAKTPRKLRCTLRPALAFLREKECHRDNRFRSVEDSILFLRGKLVEIRYRQRGCARDSASRQN